MSLISYFIHSKQKIREIQNTFYFTYLIKVLSMLAVMFSTKWVTFIYIFCGVFFVALPLATNVPHSTPHTPPPFPRHFLSPLQFSPGSLFNASRAPNPQNRNNNKKKSKKLTNCRLKTESKLTSQKSVHWNKQLKQPQNIGQRTTKAQLQLLLAKISPSAVLVNNSQRFLSTLWASRPGKKYKKYLYGHFFYDGQPLISYWGKFLSIFPICYFQCQYKSEMNHIL